MGLFGRKDKENIRNQNEDVRSEELREKDQLNSNVNIDSLTIDGKTGSIRMNGNGNYSSIRMNGSGMLAVWGSPGSGKSTVAIRIAEYLSARGKDVLLVFTDLQNPVIPYYAPETSRNSGMSIGCVLSAKEAVPRLIQQNCYTFQKNSHLAFIGLKDGESSFSYSRFDISQAEKFYEAAAKVAQFVIVDCSSDILSSYLTSTALLHADSVLQLCTCDLKSLSYFHSQRPYFTEEKWNYDSHIIVGNMIRNQNPVGSIESHFGQVRYKLPYDQDMMENFLEGNFAMPGKSKQGRNFSSIIGQIGMEVFGI